MGHCKAFNAGPLLVNVGFEPRYYFVHLFCVKVENNEHSIMRTYYSWNLIQQLQRKIFISQFIRKSHRFGMQILKLCRFIINMLRNGIIPALLLRDKSLVKTAIRQIYLCRSQQIQFVFLMN